MQKLLDIKTELSEYDKGFMDMKQNIEPKHQKIKEDLEKEELVFFDIHD
jgi:hypothetical protein